MEEAFLKCSKTILAKIETGELDPERMGSGNKKDTHPSCVLLSLSKTHRFHRHTIWRGPFEKESAGEYAEGSGLL